MSITQPLPYIFRAEEIVPTMERILSQFNQIQDEIVQTVTTVTATFDNVLQPLAQLENATMGDLGVIWMLQYAAPDKTTQDAVAQARKLYIEAEASWTARDDYYELLCAAQARDDDLDPESKWLLADTILEYKRCGRGLLNKVETDKYLEYTLQGDQLRTKFQRNVSQESGGLYFSKQELNGVSLEQMERWKDEESNSSEPHKKFVPFANGGTVAILTHAHNAATRKKMFLGDQTKLAVNVPLLHEIIKKRQVQASMLGYPSHADFRLERRLVKTTKWVEDFLKDLSAGLEPLGRQELEILQSRRLRDTNGEDNTKEKQFQQIPPWDLRYYQNLVEKEAQVDHTAISEYFPLEPTAKAMLGVFSSFLNLRFDLLTSEGLGNDLIWHETVQAFSVWDDGADIAEFLGYLYFDLLWRENKYRGNQNVTMECVSC